MGKHFLRATVLLLLLQSLTSDVFAQLALRSQEVWPSVDAYYRLDRKWRLYGTLGGTKLDESSYTDGAIGVFMDYFAFPFTKILHLNRTDDLPGRFIWFRVGYQYTATPPSAEDPFKENMFVTEFNSRHYLPYKILLTWKNRFDWRFNSGTFNSRYRPRIQIEKDLKTDYLFFTTYTFVEYFANIGNSQVNRFRTQLGVEFKVTKIINYEVFWNHQYGNPPEIQTIDAFGMSLKIYMESKKYKQLPGNSNYNEQ